MDCRSFLIGLQTASLQYISGAFMKTFSNHKPRMLSIIILQMKILGVSTICLMFLSPMLIKNTVKTENISQIYINVK